VCLELLAALAILVGLYWAFSARRSAQTTLRYQVHKDLLAEAERLVASYRRSNASVDDRLFDVERVPLELRPWLTSDLVELIDHVKTTCVPADVGRPDLASSLAETVKRVHAWTKNEFSEATRAEMRQAFIDQTFLQLDQVSSSVDRDGFVLSSHVSQLRVLATDAEAALRWRIPGKRTNLEQAAEILRRAQALIQRAPA
jgi:hypothetical protein